MNSFSLVKGTIIAFVGASSDPPSLARAKDSPSEPRNVMLEALLSTLIERKASRGECVSMIFDSPGSMDFSSPAVMLIVLFIGWFE